MDRHSKKQRSRNMAAVRSANNKTTEIAFVNLLKKNKISGWRRHPKNVFGKPDLIFPKRKLAIFIDGCFWHGCTKHRNIPTTNRKFWLKKILSNKKRGKVVNKILIKQGWKVIRIWEHKVRKDPLKILEQIKP